MTKRAVFAPSMTKAALRRAATSAPMEDARHRDVLQAAAKSLGHGLAQAGSLQADPDVPGSPKQGTTAPRQRSWPTRFE